MNFISIEEDRLCIKDSFLYLKNLRKVFFLGDKNEKR